jgi:hypothetical protein
MVESFDGRTRMLQSKVCILLLDLTTNISLHKHTKVILPLFIYLLIYLLNGLWIIYYYSFTPTRIFLEKEGSNYVKS